MYITQHHLNNVDTLISEGKVLVIYGPRQVGKTTLLNKFLEARKEKTIFVNGEDIVVRQYLESQSIEKLRDFIGNNTLLVIDEAQYIYKIGLNLKIIVDHIPGIKVIATGSSSFELANDIGEPLTGRKRVLKMFPLSQSEISRSEQRHETASNLESRLIYGSYPEVVTLRDNTLREEYLREMVQSYLYKDILVLEGIRHADKLSRLLQLLTFQVGKEVSLTELGTQLSMSKNTVEKYLDLLEKVFVIYRRTGFNRNLRKEISKNHRWYFYDNGIRNALTGNFTPLSLRNDCGELWENYVACERMKIHEYRRETVNTFFWRTYDKKEIDLVEERRGRLYGYEMKWTPKKQAKAPSDWTKAYPDAEFMMIHPENYLDFIT